MSDRISNKINGNLIDYGVVTNLNIDNRPVGSVISFRFPSSATSNPFSEAEGFGYLFVNNHPNYGIQIAVSNRGIAARSLMNGVYADWKSIIAF